MLGSGGMVGKTIISIGLVAAFRRRGRVLTPFKGVAVTNAIVTAADGRLVAEGVAQLAEAAGVEPTAEMSPVILRPLDSSVDCDLLNENYSVEFILGGRAQGIASVAQLSAQVPELRAVMASSLSRVSAQGLLLLEGSGNPSEGGPLGRLANVELARLASARGLLVTDYGRGGGVSAALGTIALLGEDADLVGGIVLNKALGVPIDASSIETLGRISGVPMLGLVAYALGSPEAFDAAVARELATRPPGRLRSQAWYDLVTNVVESALDLAAIETLAQW